MEIEFTPLEERKDYHKSKMKDEIEREERYQELIDFISSLPPLDGCTASANFNYILEVALTLYFQEVRVENLIDHVLGPIHRQFGYFWELKITGTTENPVFTFSRADQSWKTLHIKCKEGKFASCKFRKEYIGKTKAEKIFELRMECE